MHEGARGQSPPPPGSRLAFPWGEAGSRAEGKAVPTDGGSWKGDGWQKGERYFDTIDSAETGNDFEVVTSFSQS